jgi:probable rRNA maturation factor
MILNRQRRVRIRPAALEEYLVRLRGALGLAPESVDVCFLTDAQMAKLNWRCRGKRGPTDVLSFPTDGPIMTTKKLREKRIRRYQRRSRTAPSSAAASSVSITPFPSAPPWLGAVAIAPETARRNARRFGRSLEDELRVLILHGVLHLLGYDHEADNGQMERLEHRLRRELGIEPS